jgi:hypothetical protein
MFLSRAALCALLVCARLGYIANRARFLRGNREYDGPAYYSGTKIGCIPLICLCFEPLASGCIEHELLEASLLHLKMV